VHETATEAQLSNNNEYFIKHNRLENIYNNFMGGKDY